ncbi:related to RNA-splicing regulatory protein phosphatase CYT-4, mitochondrial [Rhynchosporium graminicola]|uniref:Related to RNA-splicing regulatory protein phosphatase CYT-4, mitochondrial n=1 Tax=Rhynchosporium graminicola TaxID=2792576 RepID=A0A1E1KYM9_9HELO|nr:related to RNA-splicing regulatory protein phosphatase CYT-4, mitochondrial [Rhynchosporium commune]
MAKQNSQARSSLETQTTGSSPQEPPLLASARPNIRERLRQWETDNAADIAAAATPRDDIKSIEDRPRPGEVSNEVLHVAYNDFSENTEEWSGMVEESSGLDFDRFEMVDVGESRNFLLPGDLVELLSTGSLNRELAIFVRDLGQMAQYYTMSGRWMHRGASGIKFFVPGFVDAQELDEIIPLLPDEVVDMSMEGKLQSFNESVPVAIGQPLLRKMNEFWKDANAVYQGAAMNLDKAHRSVADVSHYKYCTLDQIADKVLPKSFRKNSNGKYEWPALYAVHRSISTNEIGFRTLPLTAMRSNPYYEVNGLSEVSSISRVVGWVRNHNDSLLGEQRSHTTSADSKCFEFEDFVKKAQRLIDISRGNREYTSHGAIGPSSMTLEPGQNFRSGTSVEALTISDLFFIRFLESWACLRSFAPNSTLHAIGSAILRQINRYPEETLCQSTAWTCLQELGALPPWSTRAAFDLRLPYAGRQEAIEHRLHPPANSHQGLVPDKLAKLRKNWRQLPVYCVDETDTHEIDDGFSLETTEEPGVYWVHVHIADPASHLDPRSAISQFAEKVTETVYLPDRVVPMLPPGYFHNRMSLAPERPCLTFSTKTNLQGDMLDSKITPGYVQNVKFLTYATFREITLATKDVKHDTYSVGSQQSKPIPTRLLLTKEQIPEEEQEDLRILRLIGDARRTQLSKRGGISAGMPAPQISMSFGGHPWSKPKNLTDSLQFLGDPTITAKVEQVTPEKRGYSAEINTVADIMIMTGEMAARWCSERSIPVPYRLTPRNPDKQDPSEYFQQVLGPAQEKGAVPVEINRQYFNLIGKVQPSSTPGPHVALGVDMFMKVTSPLRRFGDLIAHWQIEAALLHEAKIGHSLAGSTDVSYLPFSRAEIDEMLPRMASRERQISLSTRDAERTAYMQLILRAWKFGEERLPPLEFTVRSINPETRVTGGVIDNLLVGGQMIVPPEIDVATVVEGDRFAVELTDMNLFRNTMLFTYLRQLDSEAEVYVAAKEK